MPLLVPDRLAPARVTGHPVRWAADFAVGGALVPLSIAWIPWWSGFGSALELASVAVPGAVIGAGVGLVSPVLLDWFRRGVPLWLLTVLAGVTGSAAMVVAWWVSGAHSALLLWVLLWAGGIAGTLLWLPYAIAAVTRRSTWPVVAAAATVAPAVALIDWMVFLANELVFRMLT